MDWNNVNNMACKMQELLIEKACEEYTTSVKLTVNLINRDLEHSMLKNYEALEELVDKIEARTNYLEKNPNFLSRLTYLKKHVNIDPMREFDEIKITLKEHSRRILDKIEETEKFHYKLLGWVKSHSRDQLTAKEGENFRDTEEENFEDCIEETHDKIEPIKEESEPEVKNDEEVGVEVAEEALPAVEPEEEESEEATNENAEVAPEKTYGNVIIQKEAYSEGKLETTINPIKLPVANDFPCEVERRKALMDVHDRLLHQLAAADSLEGFRKLMRRKPGTSTVGTSPLEDKYSGSLWFFPRKKSNLRRGGTITKTVSQKSAKAYPSQTSKLMSADSLSSPTNQEKTRRMKEHLARSRLKYYDLLDDIDGKDLKPIKSEYPRRDNIAASDMKLQEAKTYLHMMMQENDKVWKKLLQPKENNLKRTRKGTKNLMDYLTSPQQKYLDHVPRSLIVMPVRVFYDNFPTKDDNLFLTQDKAKVEEALPPNLTRSAPQSTQCSPRIPIKLPTPLTPRIFNSKSQSTKSSSSPIPIPSTKKKEMLAQLRNLKMHNDKIQFNIQNAIEVIENKMIDLLSSPADAKNSEAFTEMESEITKVLQMMNDNKGQTEPVKERKSKVMFLDTIPETPVVTVKGTRKKLLKAEKDKKHSKAQKSTMAEERKAANIEEGERLLGQVDNVIKKIDNIYNKLENKKKTSKIPNAVTSVMEIFGGLKTIIDSPLDLRSRTYEDITSKFQEAQTHRQIPESQYLLRIEQPPPKVETNVGEPHQHAKIRLPHKKANKTNASKLLIEEPNLIKQGKRPALVKPVISQRKVEKIQPIKADAPKFEMEEPNVVKIDKTLVPATPAPPVVVTNNLWPDRHQDFLKTFYTFFFSSIFVGLNMDFAC